MPGTILRPCMYIVYTGNLLNCCQEAPVLHDSNIGLSRRALNHPQEKKRKRNFLEETSDLKLLVAT